MSPNPSVEFFDTQFQRQVAAQDYALNPFEILALEYLEGAVLDLGSGLGDLRPNLRIVGRLAALLNSGPASLR
jgi:hypothetical protein